MEVAQSPLFDAATSQSRAGRIFVQIPAYRDSELSATVRDLVKKACDPASLRIAILWQKGPDDEDARVNGTKSPEYQEDIRCVVFDDAIGLRLLNYPQPLQHWQRASGVRQVTFQYSY